MEKPVIILGGGIWGSLLAFRLKEALPHIPFKLYESSQSLGNNKACAFNESDCAASLKWMNPLIEYSWDVTEHKFRKLTLRKKNKIHLLTSEKLHQVVYSALGEKHIKLGVDTSAEAALKEGSFVIDARNICYFKNSYYRQILTTEMELKEDHSITGPVFSELDGLEIFPLGRRNLLINLYESSESKDIDSQKLHDSLNQLVRDSSWQISRVISEQVKVIELPLSAPSFRQDGRLINLAGIIHDSKGCSIPMAATLIDRMVKTSFRFGELREVVKNYRNEIESERQVYRFINRLIHFKKLIPLFLKSKQPRTV